MITTRTALLSGVMSGLFAISLLSSSAVFAMGSGNPVPKPTNAKDCKKGKIWSKKKKSCLKVVVNKKCKKGRVWSKKRRRCLKISAGLMDDDNLYEVGRDLANWGRFDEAIVTLSYAQNKSDPRILNYLGYSHRKSGRVLVGLGYYKEALRIDPDYTLVREYMGEAFLQIGQLAKANEQLKEIEIRCGLGCVEYAELARQIAKYKLN